MADISQIKLPSNTTYNIKDNSAVSSLSVSGSTLTYTKRDGSTDSVTLPSESSEIGRELWMEKDPRDEETSGDQIKVLSTSIASDTSCINAHFPWYFSEIESSTAIIDNGLSAKEISATDSISCVGKISSGSSTKTTASIVQATNSTTNVQLYAGTNNRGLRDATGSGVWMIYCNNDDSYLHTGKSLCVNGHSSPIGTLVSGTGLSTVSADSGVWTQVGSISLTAGTWVVTGVAQTPGGNYRCGASLTGSTTGYSNDCISFANNMAYADLTRIVNPSSDTTIYLMAYQASGSSANLIGRSLYAVRIA